MHRHMVDGAFDVFLSYSSADRTRVRRLARRLQAAGISVWFDEWAIKPGEDIYLAVERGLESARKLVLCMSPAAFRSGWTGAERSTALFRDPSNSARRFIPVLISECDIPDALRRFRYIDFRSESRAGLAQLIEACANAEALPSKTDGSDTAHASLATFVCKLTGHAGWVWDVAVSHDGRTAASASIDSTIKIWDLEAGISRRTLRGHTGHVNCVAMSGDALRVVSASDDHTLRVWDAATGKLVRVIETEDSRIVSAVFGRENRVLSGGPRSAVRVWSTETGRRVAELRGHRDEVWAVSVSRDCKRVLSGGFDCDVRYWSLRTRQTLKILRGHSNVVNSVQFTPDGRHAVSGSDDRSVKIWDIRMPGAEVETNHAGSAV